MKNVFVAMALLVALTSTIKINAQQIIFPERYAWTVIDGIKMKSVTGGGHSGAGLFISTEDMARFGTFKNWGVCKASVRGFFIRSQFAKRD